MTHTQLIKELSDLGYIKDERIKNAFLSVDRKDFIPEEYHQYAYLNQPVPLGYGQTTSQPLVIAFMLELLDVHPGQNVLEIGTGGGWQTALLARLTAEENKESYQSPLVVSLEHIEGLYQQAKKRLEEKGFIQKGILHLEHKDANRGHEEHAPYDRIVVCASVEDPLQAWTQQLKIGGKMVLPINERIVVLEKRGKSEFDQKEFFGFSFVPLTLGA